MHYEDIIQYLRGHSSKAEQKKMERWLGEQEANRKEFERVKRLWKESGTALKAEAPDVDSAWESVREKVVKPRRRLFQIMRAAAAILILVLGYWAWQELRPAPTVTVSVTNKRAMDALLLPDGTKVWLNLNSSVSYPESFSEQERQIQLFGEAFFEVARDEQRPFLIEAEGAMVEVLGTSFGLMAYPDSSRAWIQVSTGKVAFSSEETRMELEKGQGAVLDKQSGKIERLSEAGPNELAWHSRKLDFRQTSLPEAISLLEEVYNVKIELDNEQLAQCRFTATFEEEPLDNVLKTLELIFGLEATQQGRNIRLNGEGCSPN